MARREWAEREAEKLCRKHKYFSEPAVALAFLQEHARAVRVVGRKMKELLSIASGALDQKARLVNDAQIAVLHEVETALKKGRA